MASWPRSKKCLNTISFFGSVAPEYRHVRSRFGISSNGYGYVMSFLTIRKVFGLYVVRAVACGVEATVVHDNCRPILVL